MRKLKSWNIAITLIIANVSINGLKMKKDVQFAMINSDILCCSNPKYLQNNWMHWLQINRFEMISQNEII